MARPLPKDLQEEIKGTAQKAEIRSVGAVAFGLGVAFGFGLSAAIFSDTIKGAYFPVGAGIVALFWFLSTRRRGTLERNTLKIDNS